MKFILGAASYKDKLQANGFSYAARRHGGDKRGHRERRVLTSPATRRSRPALIGFTAPTPHPAKPNPLTAILYFNCAVGVGLAKPERISALATAGRLRACHQGLQQRLSPPLDCLVTTFILKPLCSGLWPGRGGFSGVR
jgi:hypothetical protein